MTVIPNRLEMVLDEMRTVFAAMEPNAPSKLASEVQRARRTLIYGVGRNGLVLQALAMRLMHLGLDGHFVGQLSTPPIGPGDLLIAAMALGRLPTADAVVTKASETKARILIVTARPRLVANADVVINLPAQTMADPMKSVLPLGSPFELALSILCELAVVELMQKLGLSNADLAKRHTNLL